MSNKAKNTNLCFYAPVSRDLRKTVRNVNNLRCVEDIAKRLKVKLDKDTNNNLICVTLHVPDRKLPDVAEELKARRLRPQWVYVYDKKSLAIAVNHCKGWPLQDFTVDELADYEVEVCRIGYGVRTITVKARNEVEAKELALEQAGDHAFSEHDSDYVANDFSKKKITGMSA
jgi:hypothetical protein